MNWFNVKELLPEDPKHLVLVAMPFIRKKPNEDVKVSEKNWIIHLAYFKPEMGWDLPHWDGVVDVEWWLPIEVPDGNA